MPTSSKRPTKRPEDRTRRKFPSQRSRGLVDRAMFWHNAVRTWGFHGPGANQRADKLKARALNARRLLLERLAELEALAHERLGSHP